MKQGIKMDKIFVFDFIRLNTQIITQQHSLVTSHSSSQWLEALIPIHHELCVAPPFALFAQQHNIVELVCLTYNCRSVARETSLPQIKVGAKALEVLSKSYPNRINLKIFNAHGRRAHQKMVSLPPDLAHVPFLPLTNSL